MHNKKLRSLIEYDTTTEIYGRNFWTRKLQSDFFSRYICSINVIKETKIKVTLFKLFHNIMPTNILLKKWNMSDTDLCSCGEMDFIEHSMALCENIQPLWAEIKQLIFLTTNTNIHLSTEIKLFGIGADDKNIFKINSNKVTIINNILALAKFCINKARAQKLDMMLTFETEWSFRKSQFTQNVDSDMVVENHP